MDEVTVEERYWKATKRFAKLAGMWPDQSMFSKCIGRFLMIFITVVALATQMAKIVCFFSVDVTIEEVPFICVMVGILIKECTFILNEEKFKSLLSKMYEDWSQKRSKEEIDIMTMYAKRGALFTSLYIGNAYFCVFAFVNTPHMPYILDKISPRNESRDRLFIYPAYYGLDEEKYYYFMITHMSAIVVIVLFVYTTSDTAYMIVVHHACGLLAVSGYRFKHAVEDSPTNETEISVNNEHRMYRKVCFAIQGHARAILYAQEIESMYFYCLLGILTTILVAFGITLVKMSVMNISVDFYKYCSFLIIQLLRWFFLTLQGQFLIDKSNEIYDTIYEASWYNAPIKTQALFVLGLRKALSPLEVTAGGFVTMNLQSFSGVIKTSVSYFTVLKSTN